MYCYHCGYRLNKNAVESKKSSFEGVEEVDSEAKVEYICPRCGHLIHGGLEEEDAKELSRASHAQIQRANNSYAIGMCLNSLGGILLVIAILFYILAKKPSQGFVLQTNCAEFYVFIVLSVVAVILLALGVYKTVIGVRNKRHYSQLLRDINNKTFVQ